jgi:ParB family chromosome partitioning protein
VTGQRVRFTTPTTNHSPRSASCRTYEFQYIAIDQLFESKTNPRKTFDQKKLEELAESIRSGELIQPIVVRPKENAFEIVAGARRFGAGQLLKD